MISITSGSASADVPGTVQGIVFSPSSRSFEFFSNVTTTFRFIQQLLQIVQYYIK